MSRVNTSGVLDYRGTNNEGVPTRAITPEQELRRTLMACLLWEDSFYENGKSVSERLATLVPQVPADTVAALAREARSDMNLRHAPLFIAREMARGPVEHRRRVADTLEAVIQRADELAEFVALYWKDKKQPLSAQAKKGLARAFGKFNAYQLAKYNRDNPVKLRDVLFLCHAKAKDAEQALLWKSLIDGTLPPPDTWEVAISACGRDDVKKRAEFERLLAENKLGALALIRNLRKMTEIGVNDSLIRSALLNMKAERVLPFRFLAAVRHAPRFAGELEAAMLRNLEGQPKLPGTTAVLIDVSPSMAYRLSDKSEMTRMDAAAGLGVLVREVCQHARIFAFSTSIAEVPSYRGLGLVEAVKRAVPSNGTLLGAAVTQLNKESWDRLIVVTDEESQDPVPGPRANGTMVNVATSKNGVGYGPWRHIDGWSERVLDYVRAVEVAG